MLNRKSTHLVAVYLFVCSFDCLLCTHIRTQSQLVLFRRRGEHWTEKCANWWSIKWKDLDNYFSVWVFLRYAYVCAFASTGKVYFELIQAHLSWSHRGNRLATRFVYLHFFPSVLFCFWYFFCSSFTTLLICILHFVCGTIRIFGVSKCAHAFDFNRLNSTLRRYVSQQNNCKS